MYLKMAEKRTVDVNLRKQLQGVFDSADYGVASILAHRVRSGETQYLVQWENCSYLQSTWEPESRLVSAHTILSRYHARARQVVM